MSNPPAERLRVLLLEDREADAEMIIHELKRAGFDPEWRRVEDEAAAHGEERVIEVLTSGATDYLLKDRLGRLGQAVRRAVSERRLTRAAGIGLDVTERRSLEEKYRQAKKMEAIASWPTGSRTTSTIC